MSVDGLSVCGNYDSAVNGATSGICAATIREVSRALGVILVGHMCTPFLQ